MEPLKIAFAASEVVPFAKTGGLADVAGALPTELARRGHDVRLFMPLYSSIDTSKHHFSPVDFLRDLTVDLGSHRFSFSVFTTKLPGSELDDGDDGGGDGGGGDQGSGDDGAADGALAPRDVDVYFINCPALFHRPGIYTGEWDEHLRFSLLSRAVFECCQRMGWGPDLFHCNDWHTALIPLYRKTLYGWDSLFARSKSLLTIHNIAYQGAFPADVIDNLGLGAHRHLLHQEHLESGAISFLATGALYADVVSTVSRTYAREIQTEAFGQGMEGLLRARRETVVGIVNGVDYSQWNPETDPHIPHHYTVDTVAEGKAKNQAHLLKEMGLPAADGAPVLGIVSRLTGQKGFELTFEPLTEALRYLDLRLVVLGTGEDRFQDHFHWLQSTFPQKVCYYRGYSEKLAHLIEAGADVFLMPSRFEPCGLNQMYSLKYGTVPIVRKTGGLADTVQQWNGATGEGTGIVFEHYDSTGFAWALKTALTLYRDPETWARLRRNGMLQDTSWQRQGAEYEKLYRAMIRR